MRISSDYINASAFDSDITAVPQPKPAAIDEVERLDEAYLAAFGSRAGRVVLDDLVRRTMGAPSFSAGLGLLEGIAHGFAREGQNALIAEIIRRIERAKERKEHRHGTGTN